MKAIQYALAGSLVLVALAMTCSTIPKREPTVCAKGTVDYGRRCFYANYMIHCYRHRECVQ